MTTPTPATDAFPPYSGEFTTCQKCSHGEAITRHRAAGEHGISDCSTYGRSHKGERLERQCWRCDYAWDEALSPPGTADQGPVTVTQLADALQQSHEGWALDLSPNCAEVMAERLLESLLIHPRTATPAAARDNQNEGAQQ